MNIRGTVYEALSPRQRIIAAIDAIARDDAAEVERLKSTCPIKTYRQRDAAFSDTMEALLGTGLAVEADLRGTALWWLLVRAIPEDSDALLKNMAAIEAAWLALLADMGITSPTAAAPPRHPLVVALLAIAPAPESERVAENYAVLKACVPA
jgi:hypothetical protein